MFPEINTGNISMYPDMMFNEKKLQLFRPTFTSCIQVSDLGRLSTYVLKEHVDQHLPLITSIINRSE